VDRIVVRGGAARGVALRGGGTIPAERVVWNGDPVRLYRDLLPGRRRRRWTSRRLGRLRHSMGLFVLYFGTRRRYEDVAHHTIWMGKRHRGLLRDIFHRGVLADDFSLYLHRPTATDPDMAPPGCDAWYVLSPVPNLEAAIDWRAAGPAYRDRIVTALEETLLPGLRDVLVEDFYVTPEDFRDHYLSEHGAGFSVQPLLTQSAWFRFHNRSEEVRDLYLVGAGTHPGAGLPGVVTSARVLDRLVPRARPRAGVSAASRLAS
jgi:phytoene desaturase